MTTKNNELPAMLDFYADWCGPCKAMNPSIEALKAKYEGKLEIKKINVDEQPELAEMYNVRSIPTLVFLGTNGVECGRGVGAKPLAVLERTVEDLLERERVEAEKLTAG